jgi:energy-coupling factor transporter ATP-binding protein EcfA2
MEVELRNIKYENNNEVLLENINIIFKSKEITSIIGPSGSGKSLIGYLIMNLIKPTEGYTMIDGVRNYDIRKSRKDIGYVFQNSEEHFFNKTVYEEISYGLKQFRYKLDQEKERVIQAIKMVGLNEDILKKDPNTISSGEKEKVAIASSLILNPKVLVLDEPTIYLDNKSVNSLIKLLKRLKREYQKTIIVLSNDIEFIHKLSDKVILLNNGKIILKIDNKDLLNNYKILIDNNMEIPPIISFINTVNNNIDIKLKPTNDINELIKDIYRNV